MEVRASNRSRIIIRFGVVGIVMSLLLSIAKLVIGPMIHSMAVMLAAIRRGLFFIVALKPESRDEGHSIASLERDLEKAFPGVAFDIDSKLDL